MPVDGTQQAQTADKTLCFLPTSVRLAEEVGARLAACKILFCSMSQVGRIYGRKYPGLDLMRIAVIAHIRYPIASPFKGGMEAHCHQLVKALAARGHDVTLFASGDSDPTLPLHSIIDRHYEAVLPWSRWHDTETLTSFQLAAFSAAWAAIAKGNFEIVHNNSMFSELHAWAQRDRQAMITSLHVPPFEKLADAVRVHIAPWLHQTTTSAAHSASWWSNPPPTASIVHNGIDGNRWTFHPRGNGRAVWAGRITPNKGTAIALDAARRVGIALDVIGPIDCEDYYHKKVVPLLDAKRLYHGLLSGPDLVDMVGAASVFLSTPTWDEPFGLVAAEAMACGVPVAALDRGAMREVVGDCGAFAGDAPSLALAIGEAMRIPREPCRERVKRLFSIEAMIDGYEQAYLAAIEGAPPRAGQAR